MEVETIDFLFLTGLKDGTISRPPFLKPGMKPSPKNAKIIFAPLQIFFRLELCEMLSRCIELQVPNLEIFCFGLA